MCQIERDRDNDECCVVNERIDSAWPQIDSRG